MEMADKHRLPAGGFDRGDGRSVGGVVTVDAGILGVIDAVAIPIVDAGS